MDWYIQKSPTFNLSATLNCGQVFRYKEEADKTTLCALDHRAIFCSEEQGYLVDCDDIEFFKNYLDFSTNYGIIQMKSQDKGLVSSAIEFAKGIHILRQDAQETIFSFLISQNNHIPRIKGIIERMCTGLGEERDGYYAFPTVSAIANAGEDYFVSIGAGYRAAYLVETARAILEVDLDEWQKLPTAELRQKLMSLHGVGRKVADCVLLFGFGKTDVFPVDTWIRKVFAMEYGDVSAEKMADILARRYGQLAGYIQQWLYYYKRELSN